MQLEQIDSLWAVVPAGGAGTRLWPLSRASSPKFLLDLTGSGRSLIQATVDRLQPLVGDRIMVVTGATHAEAVSAQLADLPEGSIVAEPSPRDSMAAVGLAAAFLERDHGPDVVMGSFAADHVIADQDTFRSCLRQAVVAAEDNLLVTIGITPTHPSTGFGYIRKGAPVLDGVFAVEEFVEKPSAEVAGEYVDQGYLWNGGMFVVRAGVLLDLLAQNHPDLAADLRAIASNEKDLAETWPTLTKIALDHAVAEPAAAAGRVAVVPGSFGWDDVGDFASLAEILPGAGEGPTVLGDPGLVRAVDSTGLVVPAGGRTVAVIGLDDVVVVDTGDALLVTTLERAQDVKKIVEALKSDGRTDLV